MVASPQMRGVGLAVLVALLGTATPAAAVDSPALEEAYTEHLGQLVTAPGKGGVNELNGRANGTVGMRGTDLGAGFESQGRLYFLFGDSFVMGGGAHLDDSIAVTEARSATAFGCRGSPGLPAVMGRLPRCGCRAKQPRRHGGSGGGDPRLW